jgi:hypothetical protein
MATSYFTADGNYGGDEIVILDTTTWTELMWDSISESTDTDRLLLAQHFDTKAHDFTQSERSWFGIEAGLFCSICELSADELGE